MRLRALMIVALGLVITPIPVRAQDVETLRREIEQLKRQLETTQQQYQRAIEALTERLQRIEARPQVAAAPPSGPSSGGITVPSLLDLARPREPFSLYAQTAPGPAGAAPGAARGRFLFDMGIAGDFVVNLTSSRVERDQVGTFAGRENRVIPREIELSFFGQVDPYTRATVILEAAEEFEDGARALELRVGRGLPGADEPALRPRCQGGPRAAPFRAPQRAPSSRPPPARLADRAHVRFFGEEGLTEDGLEVSWVAPLPVYLQVILGAFNGDNEDAFGYGRLRDPLLSATAPDVLRARLRGCHPARCLEPLRPDDRWPAGQLPRPRRQVQVHAGRLVSRAPDRGRRDALRPPQARRRGRGR